MSKRQINTIIILVDALENKAIEYGHCSDQIERIVLFKEKEGLWKELKGYLDNIIGDPPLAVDGSVVTKLCKSCGQIKTLSEFYKDNRGKRGVRSKCKKCGNIAAREWQKVNNTRRSFMAGQRRQVHTEKERAKGRRAANIRKSTPKGKLNACISTAICNSLQRGTKARQHWETLVGYTIDDLKKHLEKQFDSNMNWENYGSYWHIDHKIPMSIFNFETPADIDFIRCWSLKNLQPLEAKKNISKRNNIKQSFQPSLLIKEIQNG